MILHLLFRHILSGLFFIYKLYFNLPNTNSYINKLVRSSTIFILIFHFHKSYFKILIGVCPFNTIYVFLMSEFGCYAVTRWNCNKSIILIFKLGFYGNFLQTVHKFFLQYFTNKVFFIIWHHNSDLRGRNTFHVYLSLSMRTTPNWHCTRWSELNKNWTDKRRFEPGTIQARCRRQFFD